MRNKWETNMQVSSRLSIHGHERDRTTGSTGLHGGRGRKGVQDPSLSAEEKTGGSDTPGNKNYRSLTEAVSIEKIQLAISRHSNIEPEVLIGKSRQGVIIPWRQMLYTLAYDLTGHGLPEIGRQLNRDHTTILHGIKKFNKLCEQNPMVYKIYKSLRDELSRM